MKRIAKMIPMLAVAALFSSAPAGAAGTMGTVEDSGLKKDECLLVAMNCKSQVDSIQQRIDRLTGEIARGRDVYTADELKVLRDKLDEANKTLDLIITNGGG